MKLGTFVFLLMIILISFGYVISDDLQAHRRLDQALAETENLNSQIVQANQQLSSCQEAIQNDQQLISQQGTEIASLKSMISGKDNEIGSLKTVISQQASRITGLEKDLMRPNQETSHVQANQSVNAWLGINPVVLAAILVTQLVVGVVQKRRKNDYIRLSREELALIINRRRMKKM